jgi:hypothetical protein
MHPPVSWKRFVEVRDRAQEYYDRALKAEGKIDALKRDGALSRLAAKLDAEEAKAARERRTSATTINNLLEQLAIKDKVIAGLSNQLDHALGYTPQELAILDARSVSS